MEMEILSIGEKIKRARVYKGFKLKDVCEEKISVSKMSCIENNKIQPEEWILKFISEKLEIEYSYLNETVEEQLSKSLDYLKKNKKLNDYKNQLEINLYSCEKYKLYNLAIQYIHLLFNYSLDNNDFEIQNLCTRYYDLYHKAYSEENRQIFYVDVAGYFYENKEYNQALNYYADIRKVLTDKKDKNDTEYKRLIAVMYNLAAVYVMIKNYKEAYDNAIKLIDFMDYVDKEWKKAEIYHMIAMLSLRLDKAKFEFYEQKSYEYYKDDLKLKAQAMYNYASVMFDMGEIDKGVDYIKSCLKYYPKDDMESLVKYMLMSLEELVGKDLIDEAENICDDTLNYSIKIDNIKYIDKSYYFKSIILQKKNQYNMAEMYMNLALDSLLKFGNKEEIYNRYVEIGNMYYKADNVSESLKYFDLAIKLQKKM